MSEQNLVEVYRAQNSMQAHLVRSVLEDEGIPAVVDGDVLQGVIGAMPAGWAGAPRVLVDGDHESRAREIVNRADLEFAQDEDEDGAKCLACGAPMSESDVACAQCGWSHLGGTAENP